MTIGFCIIGICLFPITCLSLFLVGRYKKPSANRLCSFSVLRSCNSIAEEDEIVLLQPDLQVLPSTLHYSTLTRRLSRACKWRLLDERERQFSALSSQRSCSSEGMPPQQPMQAFMPTPMQQPMAQAPLMPPSAFFFLQHLAWGS